MEREKRVIGKAWHPVDKHEMPLEEFTGRVTSVTEDPGRLATIDQVIEAVIAESGGAVEDYCQFSNNVGVRLGKAGLFLEAIECFEFAFSREGPYKLGRAQYAENFILDVNNYLDKVQTVSPQVSEWFKDKAPSLAEAQECVVHFKNYMIHRQGNETLTTSGGAIKWNDQGSLDMARSLQQTEQVGQSLLKTLEFMQT